MSVIANLERVLVQRLPPRVVKSLQDLKAKLPTRLPQAPPVAVMYVADGTTRSYVGLNNFYSFLLAHEHTDATADLEFFSPSGRRVLRHTLELEDFGARAVDVSDLFARRGVSSSYGIVTVQITPRHPRRIIYRELGAAYSQFFVFYTGGGSVAQVHPLSQLGSHNRLGEPFESSQWITTEGLERLEVLQYNPCSVRRRIEHRLLDARTREVVVSRTVDLAARGAARSEFPMTALPAELLFAMDRLPSENAKPMLRRVYAGDVATMSHA